MRVCMGIFTTALENKKIGQILTKNTSPYFHSALPVIWRLLRWREPILASYLFGGFLHTLEKSVSNRFLQSRDPD